MNETSHCERWEKNLQDIITDHLVGSLWSERRLTGKPTQPWLCLPGGRDGIFRRVTASSAGAPGPGLPVDGVLLGLAGKSQATEAPIEGTIKVGMGRQGRQSDLGTETPLASQGSSLGPKPSFSATTTIFYPHQWLHSGLALPAEPWTPCLKDGHKCFFMKRHEAADLGGSKPLSPERKTEVQGAYLRPPTPPGPVHFSETTCLQSPGKNSQTRAAGSRQVV